MLAFTVDEIRTLKKKYGLSNALLSDESGVPLGTVNKVLSGATACPRSDTLIALTRPLIERQAQIKSDSFHAHCCKPDPTDAMACEEAIAYGAPADKEPGQYTIGDYEALPEEHRVELIDGFFYDMAAPTTIHQSIALTIAFYIKAFIKERGGNCIPFISPVDVQLAASDDRTIVQPDVLIVCDPSKVGEKRIIGAPDFILEIISPSTAAKDYYKKAAKYGESGVREYWIIDPICRQLTIYYFETGQPIMICPLEKQMGVGIYNNELLIDLDEIGRLCRTQNT